MMVYLVEDYDSEVKFETESRIIGLTPEACYELEKNNIKYDILENYINFAEFMKAEDEYLNPEKWGRKEKSRGRSGR